MTTCLNRAFVASYRQFNVDDGQQQLPLHFLQKPNAFLFSAHLFHIWHSLDCITSLKQLHKLDFLAPHCFLSIYLTSSLYFTSFALSPSLTSCTAVIDQAQFPDMIMYH